MASIGNTAILQDISQVLVQLLKQMEHLEACIALQNPWTVSKFLYCLVKRRGLFLKVGVTIVVPLSVYAYNGMTIKLSGGSGDDEACIAH